MNSLKVRIFKLTQEKLSKNQLAKYRFINNYANVHIFDISKTNIQVSQLWLANLLISFSKCYYEVR